MALKATRTDEPAWGQTVQSEGEPKRVEENQETVDPNKSKEESGSRKKGRRRQMKTGMLPGLAMVTQQGQQWGYSGE